jgi:outer membrane protein assembly factor BamB
MVSEIDECRIDYSELKVILFNLIKDNVLKFEDRNINILNSKGLHEKWIFDFKSVFFDPVFLDVYAKIFWKLYSDKYPFQVGGLESACIPLIAAISIEGLKNGKKVNGFFIRKERKNTGLQNIVEGKINEEKIILVDDILNSGDSQNKIISVLSSIDKKAHYIFSIIQFKDNDLYKFDDELKINSIFSISDFGVSDDKNIVTPNYKDFKIKWITGAMSPNFFYVIPKSAPVIDDSMVYFGSDSGILWAINQIDGKECWRFKMRGFKARDKAIFSSPALSSKNLYFGAYDGNFYCLDKKTGLQKWVFSEADWVGSSPCVVERLNKVFVGLEFGLLKKRGGIVALDLLTGKKIWNYIFDEYVHSSPSYNYKKNIVVIGSNNGRVYGLNGSSGKLLWTVQTGAEVKASFEFSSDGSHVYFGSFDGKVYLVDVLNGNVKYTFQTGDKIFSTPVFNNGYVFVSSEDKIIYCLNSNDLSLVWLFKTGGRILSSPIVIDENIYVGSNDGILYELNMKTGFNSSIFQSSERIVNKIAYNKGTEMFFVPTFANEIICLSKNRKN